MIMGTKKNIIRRYCTRVFWFIAWGSVVSCSQESLTRDASSLPEGHFKNPLYYADFPDPDIVKSGSDFYMVTSSFPYSPGLPIHHSTDLVHWDLIANAFETQHSSHYDTPRHGDGVFAPSIKEHNGTFYIYYGDPDFGIVMMKSTHPSGPWTPPKVIKEAKGWIDPTPFWDEDGNAYMILAYAKSRAGINSVLVLHKLSSEGDQILDDGVIIYDGTDENPIIEGPKLYKRGEYYYIFAPAGSVPYGWETVLRSKNIYGPYEFRKVLHQGRTSINGPHQGSWIALDSGEDWFLHFQDFDSYGRIPHLNPLSWTEDDWPIIGIDSDNDGIGEPVMSAPYPKVANPTPPKDPKTSDSFNDLASTPSYLQPQWRWHGNYNPEWFSLSERIGHLRLFALPVDNGDINLVQMPNFLSQKFPDIAFEVVAKIDVSELKEGGEFGMGVSGETYAALTIRKTPTQTLASYKTRYQARNSAIEQTLHKVHFNNDTNQEFFIKLVVEQGALCDFYISQDGQEYYKMGSDFKASKLRWVGASFGFYAASSQDSDRGYTDIDYVEVSYTPQNKR
jgi:beta-xylosidase